jgi:septum site-determining protein MinC
MQRFAKISQDSIDVRKPVHHQEPAHIGWRLFNPGLDFMSKNQARKPLEIKISTVVAVAALLGETDYSTLSAALTQITGGTPDYFEDEFTLLDFSATDPQPTAGSIDWTALIALFKSHGLNPVAVRNAPSDLEAEIRSHGLAIDSMPTPVAAPVAVPVTAQPVTTSSSEQQQLALDQLETNQVPAAAPVVASTAPVQTEAAAHTMIIDTPVRTGQRIYARGADLVLMAMVNAGAEVIADGSIHAYAPLRGRALAGASGNTKARIFAMVMEAELVSIAGVYKTFEQGWPGNLVKKPVQVMLQDDKLEMRPISIT